MKKKNRGIVILLLILIWIAYKNMDVTDGTESLGEGLHGVWHAHSDAYRGVEVRIDADSVQIKDGGRSICDEQYSFDERTGLVTGAYRQDFELFALFEYRDGEDGVNGRPVLIGSAMRQDGGTDEIWFSKE